MQSARNCGGENRVDVWSIFPHKKISPQHRVRLLTHCPPSSSDCGSTRHDRYQWCKRAYWRRRVICIWFLPVPLSSYAPVSTSWVFYYFACYMLFTNHMRLPAPSQIRLTCEDPAILVQKYGKYLHSDSTKTYRVVLDSQRLSEVFGPWEFACCLPRWSPGTISKYYTRTSNRSWAPEWILSVVDIWPWLLGSSCFCRKSFPRNERLATHSPRKVTGHHLSCYSGGWLVKPDYRNQQMNVTGITAAGEDTKSSSSPLSRSIGRVSGSLESFNA